MHGAESFKDAATCGLRSGDERAEIERRVIARNRGTRAARFAALGGTDRKLLRPVERGLIGVP
jgi:hypothetical protein